MSTANHVIKNRARELGVCLWEIADALGISEATMTRLMRSEVSEEKRDELLQAIDRIATQKGGMQNAE